MSLQGFHHLTAITADIGGNNRFFTDTLGMRRVKKTVNQDDVSAYHLFYADGRGSLVSFALDSAHPHDVAEILGREGVCVRAGHHCAQPLMRRLGVPASTRASFAVHATRDDVDRLIDALGTVQEIFG